MQGVRELRDELQPDRGPHVLQPGERALAARDAWVFTEDGIASETGTGDDRRLALPAQAIATFFLPIDGNEDTIVGRRLRIGSTPGVALTATLDGVTLPLSEDAPGEWSASGRCMTAGIHQVRVQSSSSADLAWVELLAD